MHKIKILTGGAGVVTGVALAMLFCPAVFGVVGAVVLAGIGAEITGFSLFIMHQLALAIDQRVDDIEKKSLDEAEVINQRVIIIYKKIAKELFNEDDDCPSMNIQDLFSCSKINRSDFSNEVICNLRHLIESKISAKDFQNRITNKKGAFITYVDKEFSLSLIIKLIMPYLVTEKGSDFQIQSVAFMLLTHAKNQFIAHESNKTRKQTIENAWTAFRCELMKHAM